MTLLRPALCLALILPLPALAADEVRVYRCVGSSGAVALQDKPCTAGRQEVRDLQRPRDPPPRAASTRPAPPADAPVLRDREVRHVYVQPPQPMYECVSEDGDRYTSDSNEGNPRWVPLWTTVWYPRGHYGGPGPRPHPGPRPAGSGLSIGSGTPIHHAPSVGVGVNVPAGNILVRDTCHALPPQEVCARLRDRRWELDRRYNSALQSERTAISNEQRGIDARLAQDCRGG
ncbi:DUF4124 domain-containing protein [Stenotrophomonas maltophilia]|uniref:DUF4124 domain-containing protein n=1 Tax=Stenotrophomonas maltophilia TaxID=40324 RepID=UPI0034DB4654